LDLVVKFVFESSNRSSSYLVVAVIVMAVILVRVIVIIVVVVVVVTVGVVVVVLCPKCEWIDRAFPSICIKPFPVVVVGNSCSW